MIWHVPKPLLKQRVWTRTAFGLDIAFSGIFSPPPSRRWPDLWFLCGWRLAWDDLQGGVVVATPICVIEVVRCWIPF